MDKNDEYYQPQRSGHVSLFIDLQLSLLKDQVEEYIALNQRGYTHMHTKENLLLKDQQNMWSGTSKSKTCLVHVRLVNGSDGALLLFTVDPSIRSLSRSFFSLPLLLFSFHFFWP